MSNNEYLLPGLGALALAILFPVYWFTEIGMAGYFPEIDALANGLSPLDIVFLLVGALNIYFYLSLRRILVDHHQYKKLNVVLAIMIGFCAAFHLGTFFVDALASSVDSDLASGLIVTITLVSLIAFGVLDIIVGIMLLRDGGEMAALIRIFAVVTLIQGIFEVSIVFSPLVLIVFPLSALFLAVHFLRPAEMVEVV